MRRSFFFLVLALFCFACGNESGPKEEKPVVASPPKPAPVYYFYPRANVYFDSVNKDYVFLTGDGKTWITEKQIPAAVQSLMDKGVLIDSPPQPVWKENESHRLVYSAALYASPSDTVESKAPVAKADTVVKKEKRRSGIRRFFDKLFGKKEKKKDS